MSGRNRDNINRRSFLARSAGLVGAGIVGLSGCQDETETGPTFACLRRDESNLAQAAPAIDPQLLAYRELDPIPTGLDQPRGLALGPDGRLHIVGDQVIRIFEQNGSSPYEVRLDSAPQALAVADDGMVPVPSKGRVVHVRPGEAAGAFLAAYE